MRKDTIKRELAALSARIPERMPKVIVLLVWPDGHATHDAIDYASVDEALDILRPEDHIICRVIDYSKPAEAGKE